MVLSNWQSGLGSRSLHWLLLVGVWCVLSINAIGDVLAQAQSRPNGKPVTVAVLKHLEEYYTDPIDSLFVSELQTLIGSEFDLEVIDYRTGWERAEVDEAIEEIYADPDVDVLLVLGFAANQQAMKRTSYAKPTFLPFVIENRDFSASPATGVGHKNLNYLTYSTQLLDSIDILKEVVDFDTIAILSDETVINALPAEFREQMGDTYSGVQIEIVPHDGSEAPLINLIPGTAEAAIIGLLPRMADDDMQALIDGLIERKIPSFSYLGRGLVNRGILATAMNDSVYVLAARRNALNIQAVLLGEQANEQPVMVDSKPKIQINQKTAEQIGIAINFKTLINADVIGFGEGLDADEFSLNELVAEALKNNLSIKSQTLGRQIQDSEEGIAVSALRPQIAVDADYLKRKEDSLLVSQGFATADSSDISVSATQVLFSESRLANSRIQKHLSNAADAELRQVTLDVVRETTLAMASVLQAEAEAAINQENLEFSESNLELAIDRVGLGATSAADQYRWEAQVANARSSVFGAYSRVLIAQQNLNRVLNRDVHLPIQVNAVDMDQITLFTVDEIFEIMDNADTFEHLYTMGLEQTYEASPELIRLQSLVDAKERELKSLKRQRWVPEVGLSGQLTDNIDNATLQGGSGQDWQVLLNARIPIFQGGALKHKQTKASLERDQLHTQNELTRKVLAQELRQSMNNLLTALFNLDFTQKAATASSKSLSLVTESYNQGAVSIVELLDSQNASIAANLGAVQANIAYMRAAVEMQRIMGDYDFLLSTSERETLRARYFQEFERYKSMSRNERQKQRIR